MDSAGPGGADDIRRRLEEEVHEHGLACGQMMIDDDDGDDDDARGDGSMHVPSLGTFPGSERKRRLRCVGG